MNDLDGEERKQRKEKDWKIQELYQGLKSLNQRKTRRNVFNDFCCCKNRFTARQDKNGKRFDLYHVFSFYVNAYYMHFKNQLENPAFPRVLIVIPAVQPHLVVNYDFLLFFPLNLESQTKNIPVGLPSSPNQNFRKIGQGVPEF